jgi:hypothetical protein
MRPVHRTLALLLATLACGAARAAAQTPEARPEVRIAGRLQVHFADVAGDSSTNFNPLRATSTFFVRRLRVQADVRIGPRVTFSIQPSFEMGALRMRDAWLRLALVPEGPVRLDLTVGQEKKPFNRYELTSSNTLVVLERGLQAGGFTDPAVQNNLLEANGYIAHDLGASVDLLAADGRLAFEAGVYNGSGESATDVNHAKSFGARATATLLRAEGGAPRLRAGLALASRDRGVTTTTVSSVFHPDSSHRSTAWGLELEWGGFRPGLHVLADFATGEHLGDPAFRFDQGRNRGAVRAGAPAGAFTTFRSLQVVASWRTPSLGNGTSLVRTIEPALRMDLTDPDTDTDNTGAMLITPALNLHATATTVLRVGVDFFAYRDAAGVRRTIRALRLVWQSNF